MQLSEMRGVVRDNLLDASAEGDFWTNARLTRKVNQALQHVCNIVIAQRAAVLAEDWAGAISNTSSLPWVTVTLTGDYTRARRLLTVVRTGTTGDDIGLDIIDFTEIDKYVKKAMTSHPRAFIYNETVGFVCPTDATAVKIAFAAGLPDMVADTDTPGQASGSGTANRLPIEYQPLITTEATIGCLAAMGLPTRDWETIFSRLATGLGLALQERRDPARR